MKSYRIVSALVVCLMLGVGITICHRADEGKAYRDSIEVAVLPVIDTETEMLAETETMVETENFCETQTEEQTTEQLPVEPEEESDSSEQPEEPEVPSEPDHEPEPAESVPTSVWAESVPQFGEPIIPQPGDTTGTWNPEKIALYPADEACSDIRLLEKWMDVEGLTMEDLAERDCSQLVLVVALASTGTDTYTVCFEKQGDGTWTPADGMPRMYGFVGSKGVCHSRLRDTKTSPSGLWGLGCAFGNAAKPEGLKMPWRDVTPYSDWVGDETTPYFNTWQERNDPNLICSWDYETAEHLEDYGEAYDYSCVVQFNTPPYVVAKHGCAIFFHCSKRPTAGCVGLQRQDMIDTLLWLDPAKNPHILITGHQVYF